MPPIQCDRRHLLPAFPKPSLQKRTGKVNIKPNNDRSHKKGGNQRADARPCPAEHPDQNAEHVGSDPAILKRRDLFIPED